MREQAACRFKASGRFQEVPMKDKIHPQLFDVNVHCACGNEFVTRSTKKEMRVEVCAACHPFFTGKQKLMDTAGRVEKFNRKYAKKADVVAPEAAAAEVPAEEAPAVDAQ
jgi:large subunit ribosomal protein L31